MFILLEMYLCIYIYRVKEYKKGNNITTWCAVVLNWTSSQFGEVFVASLNCSLVEYMTYRHIFAAAVGIPNHDDDMLVLKERVFKLLDIFLGFFCFVFFAPPQLFFK